MKVIIGLLAIAGYFAFEHYYLQPMNQLKKDEKQLEIIKKEIQKSEKDARMFEDNQTIEYEKAKAVNEEIKNDDTSTGVDFSAGNHILTL